jgi:hypothetical protein
MVQCWRGNVTDLHLCILRRILTLLQWHCKEVPVNQQGRLLHDLGHQHDRCNEYWKVIWIYIHTKWQCCLTLEFKTNIKDWHFPNGLRIMRYHSKNVWFSDVGTGFLCPNGPQILYAFLRENLPKYCTVMAVLVGNNGLSHSVFTLFISFRLHRR